MPSFWHLPRIVPHTHVWDQMWCIAYPPRIHVSDKTPARWWPWSNMLTIWSSGKWISSFFCCWHVYWWPQKEPIFGAVLRKGCEKACNQFMTCVNTLWKEVLGAISSEKYYSKQFLGPLSKWPKRLHGHVWGGDLRTNVKQRNKKSKTNDCCGKKWKDSKE